MTSEVYAVWYYKRGFVLDTCAGGSFSGPEHWDEDAAKTWHSKDEALVELKACDMDGEVDKDFELVPIIQSSYAVAARKP
jgi:hypothetical protein